MTEKKSLATTENHAADALRAAQDGGSPGIQAAIFSGRQFADRVEDLRDPADVVIADQDSRGLNADGITQDFARIKPAQPHGAGPGSSKAWSDPVKHASGARAPVNLADDIPPFCLPQGTDDTPGEDITQTYEQQQTRIPIEEAHSRTDPNSLDTSADTTTFTSPSSPPTSRAKLPQRPSAHREPNSSSSHSRPRRWDPRTWWQEEFFVDGDGRLGVLKEVEEEQARSLIQAEPARHSLPSCRWHKSKAQLQAPAPGVPVLKLTDPEGREWFLSDLFYYVEDAMDGSEEDEEVCW
ncbi:hypothetical protein VTK56DRAFT_9584 [Thermocarpiscus australiensis]